MKDLVLCLDFREVMPRMVNHPERVVVMSDPPYNQGYHYDDYDDKLDDNEYAELLRQAFNPLPSVVISYPEQTLNILAPNMTRPVSEVVAWVYPSNTAKQSRLISWWGCEPQFDKDGVGQPYRNPNDKRIKKLIAQGKQARLYDWWEVNQVKNVSKEGVHNHPCPIPYEVAERMVLTTTEPGDLVFDPFCGVGTILLAAKKNGRHYFGTDISLSYVEAAREMLDDAS